MSLVILIIVFVLLTLLFFKYYDENIMSPVIAFLVPFLAALVVAYAFRHSWSLVLSDKTFISILIGTIMLCLGAILGQKKRFNESVISFNDNRIKTSKHVLLIVIQLVYLILSVLYTKSHFSGDLLVGIALRREALTNIKEPIYISFLGAVSLVGGSMYCFLLAQRISKKNNYNILLLILNILLSMLNYIVGGSRAGLLIIVFSLICPFVMENIGNVKKSRLLFIYFVVVVVFLAIFSTFQQITLMQGRVDAAKYSFWEYMSVYCGAQIKNLDSLLNSTTGLNPVIGYSTFRSFFNVFERFGFDFSNAIRVGSEFRSVNGVQLGNCYTIFGHTVVDFGIVGSSLLMLITGYFLQLSFNSYQFAIKNNEITYFRIFFPWFYYSVFFSFFAAKLFSEVICISMIKYIICYLLIKYLWFGLGDLRHGVIKIRKIGS